MAYANEAWGGPNRLPYLLSDANVDWAQQLLQVKRWQDRHPGEECWFAYFAYPEVQPATYGIRCHALPTVDTQWMGGAEMIPPVIEGTVLLSAGDWSGCEWPTGAVNPYQSFQARKPDEVIDRAVFVYRGRFALPDAAADARAQQSLVLLKAHDLPGALALAREAVAIAPGNVYAQTALGNAASAAGDRETARAGWTRAAEVARQFEPEAQGSYLPSLEKNLRSLQ